MMEFKTSPYHEASEKVKESLFKTQSERLELEQHFNQLCKTNKNIMRSRIAVLHRKWERFLQQDKLSQARNSRILQDLNRIEVQAAILATKSEELRQIKKQHDIQLSKMVPGWLEETSQLSGLNGSKQVQPLYHSTPFKVRSPKKLVVWKDKINLLPKKLGQCESHQEDHTVSSQDFLNDVNEMKDLCFNIENQLEDSKPIPPPRHKKQMQSLRALNSKSPPSNDETIFLKSPNPDSPKISLNSSSIIRKKAFFSQSTTAVEESPSPQTPDYSKSILDGIENQRQSTVEDNHLKVMENIVAEENNVLLDNGTISESEQIAGPCKKKSISENQVRRNSPIPFQPSITTAISTRDDRSAEIVNTAEKDVDNKSSASESIITSLDSPNHLHIEKKINVDQSLQINTDRSELNLKNQGSQRKILFDREISLSQLSMSNKDDVHNSVMLSSLTSDFSVSGEDEDTTSEITASFETKDSGMEKIQADVSEDKTQLKYLKKTQTADFSEPLKSKEILSIDSDDSEDFFDKKPLNLSSYLNTLNPSTRNTSSVTDEIDYDLEDELAAALSAHSLPLDRRKALNSSQSDDNSSPSIDVKKIKSADVSGSGRPKTTMEAPKKPAKAPKPKWSMGVDSDSDISFGNGTSIPGMDSDKDDFDFYD